MSMSNQPATVPTWEVISAQPASGQDEMGRYVPGHQVNARLSTGTTFSVFVPASDLANVDKVRADIAAKAAQVAAVTNLSGTVGS